MKKKKTKFEIQISFFLEEKQFFFHSITIVIDDNTVVHCEYSSLAFVCYQFQKKKQLSSLYRTLDIDIDFLLLFLKKSLKIIQFWNKTKHKQNLVSKHKQQVNEWMERRKKCSKYRKYKCEKNKFILIKSNVVSFSVVLNLKKNIYFMLVDRWKSK